MVLAVLAVQASVALLAACRRHFRDMTFIVIVIYFNIVVIFSSVLWLAVSVDFVHGRPAAHMVLAVLAVLAALTICRRHVRSKDILIISLNFS